MLYVMYDPIPENLRLLSSLNLGKMTMKDIFKRG